MKLPHRRYQSRHFSLSWCPTRCTPSTYTKGGCHVNEVTELLTTAFEHESVARELRKQAGRQLAVIAESENADVEFQKFGLDRASAFRLIRLAVEVE